MEVNVLKIFKKLRQLKTSFELEMSSVKSASEFEMLQPSQRSSPGREDMDFQSKGVGQDEDGVHDTNGQEMQKSGEFQAAPNEYSLEDTKTLIGVLQESLPEIKMSFEKWGGTFKECEDFENLYPTRLDGIIKDAQSLEQQLKLQKEALKDRLRLLTRTLASTPPESE